MKGKRLLSGLLCVLVVSALFPLSVWALDMGSVSVNSDEIDHSTAIAAMSDGEVYTYSTVTQLGGADGTDFDIGLSAVGQGYTITTTTAHQYNIVFVLDTSGSMQDNNRVDSLVSATNGAITKLLKSGENRVGMIMFSDTAQTLVDMPDGNDAQDTFSLSLNKSDRDHYGSDNRKDWTIYLTGSSVSSGRVVTGGTNIQAGFNAAYAMLNGAENKSSAIPVIVLLSDGEPTYYFDNLKGLYTGSGSRSGNGYSSATTWNYVSHTIAQAAYIKTLMDNLQIYTIPFSLGGTNQDYANATLNPNSTNFGSARDSSWNTAISEFNSNSQLKNAVDENRNYPDGVYPAENSPESLGNAMTNIIENIQKMGPISECSDSDGNLLPTAYVDMSYTIGRGYTLEANTLKVTLEETEYLLTAQDPDTQGETVFTSSDSVFSKLLVTLKDGVLHFRVPAGLLPCNSPEPSEGGTQTLATPITLTFRLSFNVGDSGLEAGAYPTDSDATSTFYPTAGNPQYYDQYSVTAPTELAGNGAATCYAAMFPVSNYNNSNKPSLSGFATGNREDNLKFVSDLSSVEVSSYSPKGNSTPDSMSVSYGGKSVQFSEFSKKTATATFACYNPYNELVVENLTAAGVEYTDATVTEYSYMGNYDYNITVGYDKDRYGEPTRSITFEDISFYWNHGTSSYISNQGTEDYYYTTASVAASGSANAFLLNYKDGALLVKVPASGSEISLSYRVGENNITAITPTTTDQTSYAVTQVSGSTKTETTYSVEGNILYRKVSTSVGKNDLQISDGKVEQSLTSGATVNLINSVPSDPSQCVTSITLTSLAGKTQAIANSQGEADLILNLEVTGTVKSISGLDLKLGAAGTSWADGSLPFEILSVKQNGITISEGGAPTSLGTGTYQIYLRTTTPYRVVNQASVTAAVQSFTFIPEGGTASLTLHGDGSAAQQVKVILLTAAGH